MFACRDFATFQAQPGWLGQKPREQFSGLLNLAGETGTSISKVADCRLHQQHNQGWGQCSGTDCIRRGDAEQARPEGDFIVLRSNLSFSKMRLHNDNNKTPTAEQHSGKGG